MFVKKKIWLLCMHLPSVIKSGPEQKARKAFARKKAPLQNR